MLTFNKAGSAKLVNIYIFKFAHSPRDLHMFWRRMSRDGSLAPSDNACQNNCRRDFPNRKKL